MDVEGAVRTYLRADTAIQALTSSRVFFAESETTRAYPVVLINRIAGGSDDSIAEWDGDAPLLQIDVIGPERNKFVAQQVTAAVKARFAPLRRGPVSLDGAVWATGEVVDERFLDAQSPSMRPRYVLTVSLSAWSASS